MEHVLTFSQVLDRFPVFGLIGYSGMLFNDSFTSFLDCKGTF